MYVLNYPREDAEVRTARSLPCHLGDVYVNELNAPFRIRSVPFNTLTSTIPSLKSPASCSKYLAAPSTISFPMT